MRILSVRTFWLPLFTVTLVAAVFGGLLARGAREHARLLAAQARLQAELSGLKEQNERLRTERAELTSNLAAIERAAREDLGLTAPGEELAEARPTALPTRHAPPPAPKSPPEAALLGGNIAAVVPALVFAFTALLFLMWNAVGRLARGKPHATSVEEQ